MTDGRGGKRRKTYRVQNAIRATKDLETFSGLVLIDEIALGPNLAAGKTGIVGIHVLFVQGLLLVRGSEESSLFHHRRHHNHHRQQNIQCQQTILSSSDYIRKG